MLYAMSVSIYDIDCPKCSNKNWFNNGDESDLTACDVEAIRCWSCSHEFFTSDDPILIEVTFGDAKPGDVLIEDGVQTAGECV